MNNKCKFLLSLSVVFCLGLYGQTTQNFALLQQGDSKRKSALAQSSWYIKTGFSNLIHPSAPSLDLGAEFAVRKLSAEMMYGLQTPQLIQGSNTNNRIPLDSYHKLFASFRYYQTDRIASAAKVPLLYIAGEIYHAWGNGKRENDFAIDKENNRLNYNSATIKKNVWGVGVKGGVIFSFSSRVEMEYSVGLGYLYINRFYTLITVQNPIPNINYENVFLESYTDRALGAHNLPNLILNAKLNVRIF